MYEGITMKKWRIFHFSCLNLKFLGILSSLLRMPVSLFVYLTFYKFCRGKSCFISFCQKSGNAVLGLPYALASLSFCQSFNLDLLKASATLTLAELWLSLGSNHAKRALSLVHGAFPMILGQGGLELRARAFIVEAKCHLSDPSFSGKSTISNFVNRLQSFDHLL